MEAYVQGYTPVMDNATLLRVYMSAADREREYHSEHFPSRTGARQRQFEKELQRFEEDVARGVITEGEYIRGMSTLGKRYRGNSNPTAENVVQAAELSERVYRYQDMIADRGLEMPRYSARHGWIVNGARVIP